MMRFQQIERTWVAQHEHDDEVGSFSIEKDGDLDEEKTAGLDFKTS